MLPAPQEPATPVVTRPRSYGKQIATADGATGALLVVTGIMGFACVVGSIDRYDDGEDNNSRAICAVALGSLVLTGATFTLASPIIHLVHERPGAAFGAFALRAVLPAGVLLVSAESRDPASAVAGLLFVGSLVTAMFVDWFVLAVPGKPEAREPHTVAWQPSVLALRGGAGLGVVARY